MNPIPATWAGRRSGPSGEVRKKGLGRGSVQRSGDPPAVGILESVIFPNLQGEQCPPRGTEYWGILIECGRKKAMIAILVRTGAGRTCPAENALL